MIVGKVRLADATYRIKWERGSPVCGWSLGALIAGALRGGDRQMSGWQGQRGDRHQRGYGSTWTRIRADVLRRDGGRCCQCAREGRETPATEVDHIVPRCRGGTDVVANLEALCRECHAAKTAREAAAASGRRPPRPRGRFGPDGRPIWGSGQR